MSISKKKRIFDFFSKHPKINDFCIAHCVKFSFVYQDRSRFVPCLWLQYHGDGVKGGGGETMHIYIANNGGVSAFFIVHNVRLEIQIRRRLSG